MDHRIQNHNLRITATVLSAYNRFGLSFAYPSHWELAEDEDQEQTTITVSEGETCFWSVTLLNLRPLPEDVLRSAVDSFFESYPNLDVSDQKVQVCGREALAAEIDFFCWDLVGNASLRVFRTGRFTVLILHQMSDQDVEKVRTVFDLITSSLDCDRDGDVTITSRGRRV